MLISRKRDSASKPIELILEGSILEQVTTFKYLGVLLSSDLSWACHTNACCSKARQLLGLLYRRFYRNVDSSSLLKLYLALVRPHLEYAAPVWSPHTMQGITDLEKVQKFALKMCSGHWNWSYADLTEVTNVPTLENRRSYLKLVTLYKIMHGDFFFPSNIFSTSLNERQNQRSESQLHQPFARTDALKASFVPSTICLWNNLPAEAQVTNSLNSFKFYTTPLFL